MSDFGIVSDYIVGGCVKRLVHVECEPDRSNQHELNGILAMREFLGSEKREYPATYIRLDDDEEHITFSEGTVTWYDARSAHPTRSEYRFYYQHNPAIELAEAGDVLAVILLKGGEILFVTAPMHSESELTLTELFCEEVSNTFSLMEAEVAHENLTASKRLILELLGIEIEASFGTDYLPAIDEAFGGLEFPSTVEFSRLARKLAGGLSSYVSSDEALIKCWDTEEAMFRQLEGFLIDQRIASGFADSDDFLSYSQSIRQRRSSRAGHALENHLAALFDHRSISFAAQPRIDGNKRPDFLFPSLECYEDLEFVSSKLMMLGVKTTCKDRWRQVLSEADRISTKHLLTLQPRISENQTREMRDSNLQLVIPAPLHDTFSPAQQEWLWDLEHFLGKAARCQE